MVAAEQVGRCRIVLVAPDDVEVEIKALRDVIQQANHWLTDTSLDVWWWRTDSGPGLHLEGAQGLADERMRIEEADLVVAVFWTKLGTPVGDAPSGTAHELDKAWQSWRATRRPEVWVYFSSRSIPQDVALGDQFRALNRYRKELPAEQGTWEYTDDSDLSTTFADHLGNWLSRHDRSPATADAVRTDLLFTPPSTADSVVRKDQVQFLAETLSGSGPVTLYGLSGSGKTKLAAQYGESAKRLPDHRSLIWYDVAKGSTLEEMLVALPGEYSGQGELGINLRAKHLLTALRLRQKLLVLDDFHNADHGSFAPLLRAAAAQPVPCHLLLVSRTALDLPDVKQISVRAWSTEEVAELIQDLDIRRLPAPLTRELTARTGGLPLAVKFFSVLVTSFSRDPKRLLAGELAQTHLTESWFSEIKAGLSEHELTLLRYFSLAQPDITEPVARGAQRAVPEQQGGRALSRLQALMLVEAQAHGKWSVHPFVAEHTINDIPEPERRRLLSGLVSFTSAPLARRRSGEITQRDLAAALRSCRYAQQAGDSEQAAKIVEGIAGAAKRLGYYRPLRDLCHWHVVHHEERYPWIYFHYAHCQLILGEVNAAIDTFEALHDNGDLSLRYTAARCLADAWSEAGKHDKALSVLREALATAPGRGKAARRSYEYAQIPLARTLVALGQLDEAEAIATRIAEKKDQPRSRGAALNVLGLVDHRRGRDTDVGRFRSALAEFSSVDDFRGVAWAQQHLADVLIARYGSGSAELRRCVRGVLSIRQRSGESSTDYAAWLDRIREHFHRDHGTLHMIDQERTRLGTGW